MKESKYTPPKDIEHPLTKKEFSSILDKRKKILFMIGRKYLKSNADVKDAFQETVLALWKNKTNINTNLAAAAMKKMKFVCIDILRKRKLDENLLKKIKPAASSNYKNSQETKHINWESYLKDISQQFNLDRFLSLQEKQAIIYKSEGYLAPEIADLMIEDGFLDMTSYRVNKAIERARKKLRKQEYFVSKRKHR